MLRSFRAEDNGRCALFRGDAGQLAVHLADCLVYIRRAQVAQQREEKTSLSLGAAVVQETLLPS